MMIVVVLHLSRKRGKETGGGVGTVWRASERVCVAARSNGAGERDEKFLEEMTPPYRGIIDRFVIWRK